MWNLFIVNPIKKKFANENTISQQNRLTIELRFESVESVRFRGEGDCSLSNRI